MFAKIDAAIQKRIDGFPTPTFLPWLMSAIGAMLAFLLPGIGVLTGIIQGPLQDGDPSVGWIYIVLWAGVMLINVVLNRPYLTNGRWSGERPVMALMGLCNFGFPMWFNFMSGVGMLLLVSSAYMWRTNNNAENTLDEWHHCVE